MGRWYRFAPLGIVAGLLGILAFMAPGGQELEEKFGLHWLFHLRGTVKPPDDVIIIAIDHPSATQFGLPLLPRLWPRDMHARLIERLTAAGVQNVVFDLIFDAPSQVPEYDEELSRAMAASNNTILIERLTYQALNVQNESVYADIRYEGVTELLPVIADAARARAPFPLPKAERVNTYWTFKESAGDFPTAPVVVLQLFTLPLYDEFIRLLTTVDSALVAQLPANAASVVDIEDLVFAMRQLLTNHPNAAARIQAELYRTDWLDAVQKQHIAALLIAYSSDEKHYLNFYGPPRTVKTIPYHQALQSLTSGDQHRLLEFKDKVVFVGFSGATQPEQDIVRDDYHTVFSNPDGLYISGVEIAATAFANLLENRPLRPVSLTGGLAIIFLFGLFLGFVFQQISTRHAILFGVSMIAAYTLAAHHSFTTGVLWIPLVIPLAQLLFIFVAAEVLKHQATRLKAKQLVDQLEEVKKFLSSSYPNPDIEAVLGKEHDELGICGTCLTTDVEGYTALSESMDPRALGRLMSRYRDVLKKPIRQQHGHIMDMIGDSMLAVWIAAREHAIVRMQACQAALDLAAAVERFNRSQPEGKPMLPTRIGLHFGEMSLRRGDGNYSVTGDVVNTANRIQGANKIFKTRILLSCEAAQGFDEFLIRSLGDFLVPGRIKPIQLFELVADRQLANQEQLRLCERFTDALSAYHAQQWFDARLRFLEILEQFPGDGPSAFFLSLCRRYENEPIDELWPIYRIANK